MSIESLLSGIIGALIATVLAVFYQHLSVHAQRRFEIMLTAVDYFDKLYYNSRNIQEYKDKLFKENYEEECLTTNSGRSVMRQTQWRRLQEYIPVLLWYTAKTAVLYLNLTYCATNFIQWL